LLQRRASALARKRTCAAPLREGQAREAPARHDGAHGGDLERAHRLAVGAEDAVERRRGVGLVEARERRGGGGVGEHGGERGRVGGGDALQLADGRCEGVRA